MKHYVDISVLQASQERLAYIFTQFERVYISFSGGKDSTVMFHLAALEARKQNKKLGVLIVDLEAQYSATISHVQVMLEEYADISEVFWVCLPIALRNATSNFEPRWMCWDRKQEDIWVRNFPINAITDINFFNFFQPGMEFEEFVPLFGEWYSQGKKTACLVGIRADESLNRYRTVASPSWISKKQCYNGLHWTTGIEKDVFNVYPIYDWKTSDIWVFHKLFPKLAHNVIYDLMHQAGVPPSEQRLCQPYGDDQRAGIWLYHILEPDIWPKIVRRVSGSNSAALYVQETGAIMGYGAFKLPTGHTHKSFFNLLFSTLPPHLQKHYGDRFTTFISGWRRRGYKAGIPDYAPEQLEQNHWAPSWRRMCKVLLRNDYWCKGLGLQQPLSEAYGTYLALRDAKRKQAA